MKRSELENLFFPEKHMTPDTRLIFDVVAGGVINHGKYSGVMWRFEKFLY